MEVQLASARNWSIRQSIERDNAETVANYQDMDHRIMINIEQTIEQMLRSRQVYIYICNFRIWLKI
jgi:hypothetical protein